MSGDKFHNETAPLYKKPKPGFNQLFTKLIRVFTKSLTPLHYHTRRQDGIGYLFNIICVCHLYNQRKRYFLER